MGLAIYDVHTIESTAENVPIESAPRTPTVFQFTREARMTLLDFISQIGGLLGLFMGFSVISFVEVFYWFSFRLVRTRSDPM